jgi:hypothetical protein
MSEQPQEEDLSKVDINGDTVVPNIALLLKETT